MTDEEKYKEELAKNGVDLPEEPEGDEPKDEPKVEAPKVEPTPKDKDKAPLQEKPKEEPRKRSIYEVYKDTKTDLRTEREAREQAERDRDEMAEKLRLATEGKGEDIEAGEDAIAYAKKVGADPALVQRIIEDARKGVPPQIDESLTKRLEAFETWQKQNGKAIEQQMFNDEFDRTVPELKKLFPSVNDTELKEIKSKLDELSHTKDWHDKPLDYIAFKHQDTLSALVSPKKRGMESKSRQDAEAPSVEFNPEADLSKMTGKERAEWEKTYNQMTKSDGLITDAQGKKLIV